MEHKTVGIARLFAHVAAHGTCDAGMVVQVDRDVVCAWRREAVGEGVEVKHRLKVVDLALGFRV